MDHLTEPIERLRCDAEDFAADERLRLLEVTADEELLEAALVSLRGLEWSPAHRRAVFVLDALASEDDVTTAWEKAVASRYAALREAFSKTGVALPEGTDGADADPIVRLALALHRAATALSQPPAPTSGILVIAHVAGEAWPVLEQLLQVPSLAPVKWCVLNDPSVTRRSKRRRSRPEWWRGVDCLIDRARQREELDDLLSALAGAPDEAVGPLAAGGAGPAVAPPRHPTDPPAPERATLSARDVLRPFFAAVDALRKSDAHAAIEAQRLALDRAIAASNVPLAVEMESLLATYAVAAAGGDVRQMGPALKVYERAANRARTAGLTVQSAKLDLLLGVVAKTAGALELSGQALRRCADTARDVAPGLAIEALRTAAEFLLEVKAPKRAVSLLEEALAIADGMPASEAVHTSAALCASTLAPLLRAQRLEARALSAEAAARRLSGAPANATAEDVT